MSEIKSIGTISIIFKNIDGSEESIIIKNQVLRLGKYALAKSLANNFGNNYQFFISNVLFGSSGTVGGEPRYVDDTRTAIFGPTTLTKPVIASIDPSILSKVTFTSVVAFNELVGQTINEMALQMSNGDLFSMATFGDISKTASIQLIFNWAMNFV